MMEEALSLVAECARRLTARRWTLGVAESCTGGLICHWITSLPGSSDFFIGGVVSYANRIKRDLVGVSEELLIAHGAVSREVAQAMAEGVRRALRTEVGIAVTGIAGPTGGTPTKPVGTTYIAVSSPLGTVVQHHVWPHDREGNKRASARAALELLLRQIAEDRAGRTF
ncbi:MAG: CinA family protein [Chloroflexi bacterium]|nr:CinA family protein [Chloroflexota bacterium]